MPPAATSKRRTATTTTDAPVFPGQLSRDLGVDWRSVARVTRYTNNPRANERAVPEVAKSLVDFGWQQPIVIDKHGVIVVGDTRFLAALYLQQTHVPVYVAKHLTPEKAKAYRLADNKYGERAKWDFGKLKLEFEGLQEMGANMALTGFQDFEMEPIVASEWSPPAATGTLGGERDNEKAKGKGDDDEQPEVARFTVDQLEVVLAAAEKARKELPKLTVNSTLAECLVSICRQYARAK